MPTILKHPANSSHGNLRPKRVLALSSGGGHWVQLKRLIPAFKNCEMIFATTNKDYQKDIGDTRFKVIPDSNRWNKFKLAKCAVGIFILILREQPDVIISTGAAPGYFAILIGRIMGKQTVWVDSIANAEELSMSGKRAGKYADLWLTQWQHLARPEGPHFFGNVLG